MANTLVEYQRLTTDVLVKGILDTIIKESPILQKLPFKQIVGKAYLYNLESALATAGFYAVGDTWTEGTPTWAQRTTALCILGGDADVDSFAKQTMGNEQDVAAAIIEKKAKAISHEFERCIVYGGTTTTKSAKEFEGLLQCVAECESVATTDLDAINNVQVIANDPISGALTMAKLDELIDAIKPGVPDMLIMSRRARRKLNALARTTSGSPLQWEQNEFGKFIAIYNGIPIAINDFIVDNLDDNVSSVCDIAAYVYAQTRAATKDNSPLFAVKFGEDALCGLQNDGVQTEDLGKLESKDANRYRIKWYVGMALHSIRAAAVLTGMNPDD